MGSRYIVRFDVCADPVVTLQRAAELGVDTILTSGQEADCVAGCELLRRLVQLSADKCEGIDSYWQTCHTGWRRGQFSEYSRNC